MKKKMHIRYGLLAIPIWALLFCSCGHEEEIVSLDTIPLERFDTVHINAIFDVELMPADAYSIRISGDKKLIEDIAFEVRDLTLTIENKNKPLWTSPALHPPVLRISSPTITHVQSYETCNIRCLDTIRTPNFGVAIGDKLGYADVLFNGYWFYFWNGAPSGGHVRVSGKATFLHVFNINLMEVDATGLSSEYAILENASKGNVSAVVHQQLNYSITGTGNINVSGNPPLIIPGEITSSGKLILQ